VTKPHVKFNEIRDKKSGKFSDYLNYSYYVCGGKFAFKNFISGERLKGERDEISRATAPHT
jgi:hypothetical protein